MARSDKVESEFQFSASCSLDQPSSLIGKTQLKLYKGQSLSITIRDRDKDFEIYLDRLIGLRKCP